MGRGKRPIGEGKKALCLKWLNSKSKEDKQNLSGKKIKSEEL